MKRMMLLLMVLMPCGIALSQMLAGDRDRDVLKSGTRSLFKITGTLDRAAGIHNKGNMGMYFENRGKLYPRRKSDGPDGEFPIKSLHDHIYRANPYVGIPGNVIQGHYTGNEEWEAVGGTHNPTQPGAAYLSVAMSDNPGSWPASGWPIRDAQNNPVFVSDQDSYCVYSDSGSTRPIGLLLKQTGYSWGVKLVSNVIFYTYEIVNISGRRLDSVYFSMYSEISIGNDSGGDPEYLDDKIVFNKAMGMYYKYDVDHKSNDWGLNPMYNEFGCMMLKTPKVSGVELGMTDWHRVFYDDDNNMDIDSIQFAVMSSDPRLKNDPYWGPRLFHNGTSPNIHFDDSLNIPTTDDVSYQSSGPYTIQPGQTLGPFVIAFVAGLNHPEFMQYATQAKRIVDLGWAVPSAPPPPTLTVIGRDKSVQVSWDNKSEIAQDKFTGNFDFEGYKLYRSSDDGVNWTMLAQFDRTNDLPPNNGIQYTYEDKDVTNGFEYWYSITAYDRGDSLVERLESPIGSNTGLPNLKIGRPHEDPLGYVPATTVQWTHTGTSNYVAEVFLKDQQPNDSRQDSIRFVPYALVVRGNLKTTAGLVKTTPTDTIKGNIYSVRFYDQSGVLRFQVRDTATQLIVKTVNYKADTAFAFVGVGKGTSIIFSERDTSADFKPQAGDSLLLSPGVFVTADMDTILPVQPLLLNTMLASTNRLLFRFTAPSPVVSQQTVAGAGLTVVPTAQYADSAVNTLYRISVLTTYANNTLRLQVIDTSRSATVPFATMDSLKSTGAWVFSDRGVLFKVTFSAASVPDSTTVVEIVTRKLVRPSYGDLYTFKLQGWSVDRDRARNELDKIKVVPNPYIVSSLYEKDFGTLRREPLRVIRFIHLPDECTITIFTLDGDVVQTINHSNKTGEETWDLRAAGKREIVAGIYLYHVKTSYGDRLSRFAVIK